MKLVVNYSGKTVSKGIEFLRETAGILLYHKSDILCQLLQNIYLDMTGVETLRKFGKKRAVY